MTIFLTGATGYLGAYTARDLLEEHGQHLTLLVRAKSKEEGARRLWRSLQMHLEFPTFHRHLNERIDIVLGDLTEPRFGLPRSELGRVARDIDSVIHCAASLNRKSNRACFNVNLRGTLEVIKLARAAADLHGLRRFSDVSTVAVAGELQGQLVREDAMVDWSKSDYDPYARTKKFCEHMVHELLPDVPITVFRPSAVLGDSRHPRTTQFDMVRAFVFLAKLPVFPFDASWRMDIVPANFVSAGIVAVHLQERPEHDAYNLSAGADSPTYRQIVNAMHRSGFGHKNTFVPWLNRPFGKVVDALASTPREWGVSPAASLMKVFLPYLTYDSVFDNSRIVKVLGAKPASFADYCYGLFKFATEGGFRYPYQPWPDSKSA